MSRTETTRPYVYQPHGSLTDMKRAKAGRLWAVGGLPRLAHTSGLTKEEAHAIVVALNNLYDSKERDA